MIPNLPKILRGAMSVPARWYADAEAWMRASTVMPSPDILVSRSSVGTTLALSTGARAGLRETAVIVKITGAASGGGKYVGRIVTGFCTATASGNLSLPEGMTVPGSDDCLVLNLAEDGAATHLVPTNSYAVGKVVGATSGGSPVRTVEISWQPLQIRFGKPTSAYSSGSTFTLDPCDVSGTDNGLANETVYVQASHNSYSCSNSVTVATSTVVPFAKDDSGNWVALGMPKVVLTDFGVDTGSQLLQVKTRDDWGAFSSTESGWVTKHTGDVCA